MTGLDPLVQRNPGCVHPHLLGHRVLYPSRMRLCVKLFPFLLFLLRSRRRAIGRESQTSGGPDASGVIGPCRPSDKTQVEFLKHHRKGEPCSLVDESFALADQYVQVGREECVQPWMLTL